MADVKIADIKNVSDISKLKIEQVIAADPSKIKFGTDLQDCILIAQTFEKAAHSIPSEAAVFATLNRNLENSKTFSTSAQTTLNGYLKIPQESASKATQQAEQFGLQADPSSTGTTVSTEHIFQNLNVGDTKQATLGDSFGDALLDFARDCIPCSLRLFAFLELHPNIDLIGAFQTDLQSRLDMLLSIGNLLKDLNIYGDLCELLNLLSFMCVPDLQRMIAMLMALFTLEIPRLDGLIGMLQALIAPIFAPILTAITSLLDQFVLIVSNPLECIIDAVNQQIKKLGFELDSSVSNAAKIGANLTTGLGELNKMLTEAKASITEKLNFYIEEVKTMIGELGFGDASYIAASFKKLKIIRMIGFIVAIISAITRGHPACSSTGKPPEQQELDNFFETFLNPNGPFNLWIDDIGDIHIDEKVEDFPEVFADLPNTGNVLEFEGEPLVDPSLAQTVTDVANAINEPIKAIIPCKLEVTVQDAEKVNQFISELNSL